MFIPLISFGQTAEQLCAEQNKTGIDNKGKFISENIQLVGSFCQNKMMMTNLRLTSQKVGGGLMSTVLKQSLIMYDINSDKNMNILAKDNYSIANVYNDKNDNLMFVICWKAENGKFVYNEELSEMIFKKLEIVDNNIKNRNKN